jgi:hypothetical protein
MKSTAKTKNSSDPRHDVSCSDKTRIFTRRRDAAFESKSSTQPASSRPHDHSHIVVPHSQPAESLQPTAGPLRHTAVLTQPAAMRRPPLGGVRSGRSVRARPGRPPEDCRRLGGTRRPAARSDSRPGACRPAVRRAARAGGGGRRRRRARRAYGPCPRRSSPRWKRVTSRGRKPDAGRFCQRFFISSAARETPARRPGRRRA